ncbi:MAG: hypothetical protein SOY32_05690, partial [Candidatus Faecousia sp.]|nr:hypothetical protein [Candidatus Faecousia sp.]
LQDSIWLQNVNHTSFFIEPFSLDITPLDFPFLRARFALFIMGFLWTQIAIVICFHTNERPKLSS